MRIILVWRCEQGAKKGKNEGPITFPILEKPGQRKTSHKTAWMLAKD